jgi:hypothetical protein
MNIVKSKIYVVGFSNMKYNYQKKLCRGLLKYEIQLPKNIIDLMQRMWINFSIQIKYGCDFLHMLLVLSIISL